MKIERFGPLPLYAILVIVVLAFGAFVLRLAGTKAPGADPVAPSGSVKGTDGPVTGPLPPPPPTVTLPLPSPVSPAGSNATGSPATPNTRVTAPGVQPPDTPGPTVEKQPVVPIAPSAPVWPGVSRGTVLKAQPALAICEDDLKSGKVFEMPLVEPFTLKDGTALPVGTPIQIKVASVQKASGSDPTIARLQLESVRWNDTWQTVNAGAYRIPFERKRSVGSNALRGTAIGAAGGALVSIVFKQDLKQSVLIGAAAGAVVGAASGAGSTNLACIDPANTTFGFAF